MINRSPLAPLDFEIPEKVWTGGDISYSYLRVFGCKAFAHVPTEQRSKLDDKATPCIFVGYGDAEFGYRLWDPENKMVIRSRDVIFHKHQTLADCEKPAQPRVSIAPDLTAVPSIPQGATNGERYMMSQLQIFQS